MDLYDLEDFLSCAKEGKKDEKNFLLTPSITFSVVLDDAAIPPLEILEKFLQRELILKNGRVICQKKLEKPVFFDNIKESLSNDNEGGNSTSIPVENKEIEYDDLGTLPEGFFLFKDYVPAIHVATDGRIQQVDLMKPRDAVSGDTKPANKEFKKILLKKHEQHEWKDLITKFVRS